MAVELANLIAGDNVPTAAAAAPARTLTPAPAATAAPAAGNDGPDPLIARAERQGFPFQYILLEIAKDNGAELRAMVERRELLAAKASEWYAKMNGTPPPPAPRPLVESRSVEQIGADYWQREQERQRARAAAELDRVPRGARRDIN